VKEKRWEKITARNLMIPFAALCFYLSYFDSEGDPIFPPRQELRGHVTLRTIARDESNRPRLSILLLAKSRRSIKTPLRRD